MKYKISFKYFTITSAFLLMSNWVQAQDTQAIKAGYNGGDIFYNIFIAVGIITFLAGCYTVMRMFEKMLKFEELKLLAEQGLLTPQTATKVQKTPSWKKWYAKAWNIVPMEKEKDIMLEHAHDGIYELDNKLPPWWLGLFYITIAYAVFHVGYYYMAGYGHSTAEEYEISMKKAEEDIEKYLSSQANLVDETNVEILTEPNQISNGQAIFQEKCAVCHGGLGEGGVGPNLTDEYWLHGGGIKDVFKVVKYGVSGKGMQSWKDVLTAGQMNEVSSFIMTLKGTNPPNAKESQGELFVLADSE